MRIEEEADKSLPILPCDLIVDILSRLRVKSLVRFKSVSKSWLNLFTDPYFVKMHLKNGSHKQRKLDSWCTPASFCFSNGPPVFSLAMNDDQPKTATHIDSLLPFQTGSIRFFGSCDGLILFLNLPSRIIYLLNPCTRELHKLPKSPFQNRLTVSYGFGYDASAQDYKVVEVSCYSSRSNTSAYTLKTNSWRKVHSFPYIIMFCNRGTLFNGVLHWFTHGNMSSKIVAFHLADEKFQHFPFPYFETPIIPHAIGVLKGCLCITITGSSTREREIWVMTEYGKRESWTKVARFPSCQLDDKFGFLRDQKLVAYNLEKSTYSYIQIPCTRECEKALSTHQTLRFHEAENCLESIVSPCSHHT